MSLEGVRVAFHTLGCKVNLYETGVMTEEVRALGADVVGFQEEADVYVVNTCSVTNIADRKSRQMLHRARKANPKALVVACGCYAEAEEAEALLSTGVDLILGNEEKKHLGEILAAFLKDGTVPVRIDIGRVSKYTEETLTAVFDHTRADLKVQDGCNQFCSYCIIPYVRGRVRSKAIPDVLKEVEALSRQGIREFVLSGIHLSSYGQDLSTKENAVTLLDLIRAVASVPGVERIRLGSLEPRIVTEAFAAELSKIPSICPHFHLSLQSGDEETLKRMNRHYTPEEYRTGCAILRRYFDDPAITTDVIVGFPGETEEAFRSSYEFVKSIGFYELHVFQFSRRKGTRADRMPDQVRPEVKKARSEEMIALGKTMSKSFEARFTDRVVEVLTEERSADGRFAEGYMREYVRVSVPGGKPDRIYTGVLTFEDGRAVLTSFHEKP